MKRILLVLTVALVMAAMLVVMVAPAFAVHSNPAGAGPGTGAIAKADRAQPVTPPTGNPF